MTSSDSWRRLEEIFQGALDIPPEQRDAWLKRACAGDDLLRREVVDLLDGEPEDSPRISSIIGDTAAGLFADDSPADATVGLEFGNYRILSELGRGGMGAVYLAVRADEAFNRQVAIKLVKRGIDTDAVLQRFWYERRILAGLEHPYIARLLDGGTSPDGRPYFVMEYVDGKPLDVYAREHNLSIAERCELLRKICEAVSYAHRNLIIHRDLKPANILITGDGTPKLLDFGIARLLSIDPGENTLSGTVRGRALTPEFASPEQARGDAVTTATDVYSLGATLKAILPAEREFPADLATILHKAMREESDQRYASVADFSEDLRRYLARLPILARDQNLLYRAGKFVRRHRVGVTAFALANLVGVCGITAIIWESHKAEVQRKQAEQRLSQAVDMAERALADVNNSMASLPGTTEARRQMVRNPLDYLDQLAKDSGGDPRVIMALATAYVRVGEVLGNPNTTNLGDFAGSLATYRKALGLLDGLLRDHPNDPKTLNTAEIAHQGAGSVLQVMGHGKEAEAEDRTAVALADSNLARKPDDLELQERRLDAHYALDWLLYSRAPQEAEQDAIRQLPIVRRLAEAKPDDQARQETLSEYYSLIGTALHRQNRSQESLAYYRKAVAIREDIYRRNPRNTIHQRNLMIGYGHIADTLGSPLFPNLGDYRGALEYYRKAEHMVEEMILADPSDNRAAGDLGMIWMRIGAAQRTSGDLAASNRSLDRAIAQFESILKGTPDTAAHNGGILMAYNYRGRNMRDLGDPASALKWQHKCLATADKLIAMGHIEPQTRMMRVSALEQMGNLLAVMGDKAGALEIASRALSEAQSNRSHGGTASAIAVSWLRYARTHELLHDCAAAAPAYAKSAELWKQLGALTGAWSNAMAVAQRGAAHCGANPVDLRSDKNLP